MTRSDGRQRQARSTAVTKGSTSASKRNAPRRRATKVKLVLSSSSSISQDVAEDEEEDDDELMLSGDDEDNEEEEEGEEDGDELMLESSPVRSPPKGKLQLKLPRINLQASTATSASPSDLDDDDEEDEDELESDEGEFSEDEEEDEEEVDMSRMTSRQRARYMAASQGDLDLSAAHEALPASKKKAALSEEELLKRAEKTRRRQLQRDQKLEEHKQATIQRLLQKQGARSKKMKQEQEGFGGGDRADGQVEGQQPRKTALLESSPGYRYTDSAEGTRLLITDEAAFKSVFKPSIRTALLGPLCAAAGCSAPRRYTHPTLGKPACSLKCYKALK